jgi:tripartite ATP-independent transporter DctP family solute receptor
MPAGDPQAVRLVVEGQFEIVSVAGPIIDKLCPTVIGIQNFPFIYKSSSDVFSIINQRVFTAALNQAVANYNLTYFQNGTFDNGMRSVTSIASRPLRNTKDFQNLIIRIPPSDDMKATMIALGAIPKEFTMNQVYQSLKDQSVQAQENPPSVAMGFKLYEVTKYLNLTNHAWSGYNTFFNTQFWNRLSSPTQRVITELLPIHQAQQIKAQEAYNREVYQELTQKLGMVAIQPDLTDVHVALKPVYGRIYQRLTPAAQALIKPILSSRTGLQF